MIGTLTIWFWSDVPFFLINGYAGTLVTYGLVGLRYEGWAIMQYSSILGLTGLVTNQMITMFIWLCNSQVRMFPSQLCRGFPGKKR